MATPPLSRLVLQATSVADDLGFVALADIAEVLGTERSLIIGGHMVQLHAYRWELGSELYRETQDADLGIPLTLAKDATVVERLECRGYRRVAGNSFVRHLDDIPGGTTPAAAIGERAATIDLLIPANSTRTRSNRKVGDHLTTTEVLGLADAFNRPAVTVDLELTRLNRSTRVVSLGIPDELSALVLKVMAWRSRRAPRDAVDIWRCAEIAFAAGVSPSEFVGKTRELARRDLLKVVDRRDSEVLEAIVSYRKLSPEAGDGLHTRLKALADRLASS